MILLCGIASETPLAMVTGAVAELGLEHRVFNQRQALHTRLSFEVVDGAVDGELYLDGECLRLSDITGVYLRLMDDQALPEVQHQPPGGPARRHVRALHDAFYRWSEIAPSVVINRAEPQGSNGSKTYQAQLITRYGFKTPETLVTNDPEAARAFRERHGRVVFKSISGVRSIVRDMDDDDMATPRPHPLVSGAVPGLCAGRQCARARGRWRSVRHAHRQRRHGLSLCHAHGRRSEAAARSNCPTRRLSAASHWPPASGWSSWASTSRSRPTATPIASRSIPCPAFSYYEANTGQPIARAVARRLAS